MEANYGAAEEQQKHWCYSWQWDAAECHKKLTDQKLVTKRNKETSSFDSVYLLKYTLPGL